MTAKLGFILSVASTALFFVLMTVFVTVDIPHGPAIFSGILTLVSAIMAIVSACYWYEDTKRERKNADLGIRR